jgi:hypothetical protein
MATTALARTAARKSSRKQRVAAQRASAFVSRRGTLPEYLEPSKINALIQLAPHA